MTSKFQMIPVIITGGFSSGKTEFIRAVCDLEMASSQRTKNEAPLDFGRLHFARDRIVLHLYGWPCTRMYPNRSMLPGDTFDQCVRTIVVVDSVIEDQFPVFGPPNDQAAIDLIDCVQQRGMPFLVVASKQDKREARSVAEMRVALRLDDDIPLLPCSARTDPTSVRHALIELLKLVPQDEIVRRAILNLEQLQRAAA